VCRPAAVSTRQGLDVLRPAPPRLECRLANHTVADIQDLDLTHAAHRPHLVRRRETLLLEPHSVSELCGSARRREGRAPRGEVGAATGALTHLAARNATHSSLSCRSLGVRPAGADLDATTDQVRLKRVDGVGEPAHRSASRPAAARRTPHSSQSDDPGSPSDPTPSARAARRATTDSRSCPQHLRRLLAEHQPTRIRARSMPRRPGAGGDSGAPLSNRRKLIRRRSVYCEVSDARRLNCDPYCWATASARNPVGRPGRGCISAGG
jgi:hypothetical protein